MIIYLVLVIENTIQYVNVMQYSIHEYEVYCCE